MIRKTSAMVEAGILAAIAIVMALISMYVPVLGAFVNFVWPLPIVICGCRHGLKWSIMTLLVATIIIAMNSSPLWPMVMPPSTSRAAKPTARPARMQTIEASSVPRPPGAPESRGP